MVGLKCMLDQGLHHLDVKPDNMLLRSETEVCLTDMGTASRGATTSKGGAATFLSPELSRDHAETPGEKADVWAAGISLYAMLFGEYPYARVDLDALSWLRHLDRDARLATLPAPVRDLLRAMLALDPAQRLDIAAVLVHPWLAAPAPTPTAAASFVRLAPHTTIFTPASVAQYRRQLGPRTSRGASLQCCAVPAATQSPTPVPKEESDTKPQADADEHTDADKGADKDAQSSRGCCTLL